MAQPATIIDVPSGEIVKHGSQVIAFTPPGGGTALNLVCEEITFTKGTRAIRQMTEMGLPSKAAYVADWGQGSITVQLKASTNRLTAGFTGAILDTDGSTAMTFLVTDAGPKFSNGDSAKIQLTVAEKIN